VLSKKWTAPEDFDGSVMFVVVLLEKGIEGRHEQAEPVVLNAARAGNARFWRV